MRKRILYSLIAIMGLSYNCYATTPVNSTVPFNLNSNTLFAGYGYIYDSLYFGIERFNKKEESKSKATVLQKFECGGDFRSGVILTSGTLLYAKVGTVFNKVSHINLDKTKNILGLRLGFGLEQQIIEGWMLRADYLYTHYKKADNRVGNFFNITQNKLMNKGMSLGVSHNW